MPIKVAISVNPAAAVDASAPVRAAATAPLGVRGCPLRRLLPCCLPCQLELVVSVVVDRNRSAGTTGAQSLESCRPCRRRCSLCHRSLAFLCCSNLSLLPVLHARGDRTLRLSFGHGELVGAATWGRGCLRRAVARLCRRGGMSRDSRCFCYRLRTEGVVGRG
jgi:hypothetical protein